MGSNSSNQSIMAIDDITELARQHQLQALQSDVLTFLNSLESIIDSRNTTKKTPRQIISTLKSDLQSARAHISGTQSPIIRINQILNPEIEEYPFSLDAHNESLSNSDLTKSVEIVSKNNGKWHLRLFDKLEKYVSFKDVQCDDGGIIIDGFMENEFGKCMRMNGIKIGWKLIKIGNIDTTHKHLADIKEILAKNHDLNGYDVVFEADSYKNEMNQRVEPIKSYFFLCDFAYIY